MPGVIGGSVRLQSGQVVPIIVPAIRGMYSWATQPLVTHVLGRRAQGSGRERETYDRFSAGLTNFLDRVYYDLRNLGITGEERAINYSATNAVQIADVIRSTTRDQLDLDRLAVKKSPSAGRIRNATTSNCRSSTRTTPTSPTGSTASPST